MGTREGVAHKIEAETKVKIEEMNTMVHQQQEAVSYLVYISSHNLYCCIE